MPESTLAHTALISLKKGNDAARMGRPREGRPTRTIVIGAKRSRSSG